MDKNDIKRYNVRPWQRQKMIKEYAKHLYATNSPFRRANDPFIKNVFSTVGVDLPSDKLFRTDMLDEVDNECMQEKMRLIAVQLRVRME